MDVQLLLAALAGGAALFVWGAVSWMLLPWHNASYSEVADEDELARVIEKQAPASGIYGIPAPGCGKGGPPEARKAKLSSTQGAPPPRLLPQLLIPGFPEIWPTVPKSLNNDKEIP